MLKKRDSRQFIVINEEKLISEVQQRPILYDKALKGYRKPTIREHAWQEVADALQSTVDESKKRWRSLRDAFMKQYKQSQTEDLRFKKKKWLFYDQMEFLGPFLDLNYGMINLKEDYEENSQKEEFIFKTEYLDPDSKVYTSNINNEEIEIIEATAHQAEAEIEVNEEIIDVYGDNNIITEILRQPDSENQPIKGKKDQRQKSPGCDPSSVDSSNIEISTNIIGLDPDERFLLSCAPILKRLSDKKNALARLKMQQILYEIEFGDPI